MVRSFIVAGAALGMLAASVAAASAQPRSACRSASWSARRSQRRLHRRIRDPPRLRVPHRRCPDDLDIATIRKVGLDLGITELSALAWAVFAPVPARPRRSLRRLRRRPRQRYARYRRRRQRAGWRRPEFHRFAAAQLAGPGRLQRRRRTGVPGTFAPAGIPSPVIASQRVANARPMTVSAKQVPELFLRR